MHNYYNITINTPKCLHASDGEDDIDSVVALLPRSRLGLAVDAVAVAKESLRSGAVLWSNESMFSEVESFATSTCWS